MEKRLFFYSLEFTQKSLHYRSIPVLFWGQGYEDGTKPFVDMREDGSVVFYADIIASTFFMLSRWEETVVNVRDQHGRFPATASVAFKQGFLHQPIVDEYALILSAWIRVLLPQWSPREGSFSIKLSHDIDMVRRFPNPYRAALTIAADIIKRRNPSDAWHNLRTIIPYLDPVFASIYRLSDLSLQYGMKSAFHFMAATASSYDIGYDVFSPHVKRCIRELQLRGHEIGFHASYRSLNDLSRLAAEKAKLDAAAGTTSHGGRQHYLRFQVPYTWRHWEQLKFTYDSTMGYADHEGFRCGTCYSYRPFDIQANREINLWERPLIVMDATLWHYRNFTPSDGLRKIIGLALQCKQVRGTFILLWHNTSLKKEFGPWIGTYERALKTLSTMA